MEQYIYGNIGHRGYAFVSSNEAFFTAPNRNAPLQHLLYYDGSSVHGDLGMEEHQCFWMLSTDLNIPGEQERLYLQASGGDPTRDAFYVRGYMSQPEDGNLYSETLPRLLAARFTGLQETMTEAERDMLQPLNPADIAMDASVRPAQIEPTVLRRILLALLEKKKVILRLPFTGQKAMEQSRAYLLTIYQRLPYELRRFNGFITGISAAKLRDAKNALPGAIRLYLMDADAELTGLRDTLYQTVIDMTAPSQPEPVQPDNPLLDMLVQAEPAELDAYFRFCAAFVKNKPGGGWPDMGYYQILQDIRDIERGEFTDEKIRYWAAKLRFHQATKEFIQKLGELLAKHLTPAQLESYLEGTLEAFDSLASWGIPDNGDLRAYQENRILDTNAAQTLHMADVLMSLYPEGTQEALLHGLLEHASALAQQKHPCLWEPSPTAQTQKTLEGLDLEPVITRQTADLAAELKEQLAQQLKDRRSRVLQTYETELQTQRAQGLEAIARWDVCQPNALYEALQAYYLYDELIAEQDGGSWNEAIAGRIVGFYQEAELQTLEDFRQLRKSLRNDRKFFTQRGGSFRTEQEQALDALDASWEAVVTLSQRQCQSLDELLELWVQVNRLNLKPDLAQQLRESFAQALKLHPPTREAVLSRVGKLTSPRDNQETALIREVLTCVQGLYTIAQDASLEQIDAYFGLLERLEEAELVDTPVVYFPAWDKELPMEDLARRLSAFRTYSRKDSLPELEDSRVRVWAQKNFPENRALWLAMARWEMDAVVQHLARSGPATVEEVEFLYLHGCTKARLQAGAGQDSSLAWQHAVDERFPRLHRIPESAFLPPMVEKKDDAKWFVPCQSVLMGLAGMVPGGVLALSGEISLIAAGALTAIPVLMAAGSIAAGRLLPEAAQKRLMRWLGISQVPGVLAAAAALTLILLH